MHFRAIHIEGVDGDQIGNDQSPRDFLSGLERVGGPFDVDEDLSSPTDPSLARVSIPRIKPGMSASGRPPGTVAGSTTTGLDWLLRLNPQHFEPVRAVFVSTTTAAGPIERWPSNHPNQHAHRSRRRGARLGFSVAIVSAGWFTSTSLRRDHVFAPYRHSEGRAWSSPKVSTVCRPAKAPALRKPAARTRHGLHNDHHYVAAMDAGVIFGFSRKKLSGSYCALISLSRVMFAPYAVAVSVPVVSSACPVKFV